jgi:diacylglycerol kinase
MKKGIGLLHALRGIWAAVRRERNMRIHITAMFYVSVYAWIGGAEPWAWGVIFLCFGLVMGLETLNAALERLADEVSQEHRERIGLAKDMAAGAVLIASAASIAAAVVIFGQQDVWGRIAESPASLWPLAAVPVFAAFIFGFDLRNKRSR